MIRLPPSVIGLGRADIIDFDKRRKHASADARVRADLTNRSELHGTLPKVVPIRVRDQSQYGSAEQLAGENTYRLHDMDNGRTQMDHSQTDAISGVPSSTALSSGEVSGDVLVASSDVPETPIKATLPRSSVLGDEFKCGGYIHDRSKVTPEAFHRTVHNKNFELSTEKRQRHAFIRDSPALHSMRALRSPDYPKTLTLTPRLTTRLASHSTPSLLFSQPPRRPPQSARAFRHQANSFSFESSERSSAVYEQERVASYSTTESKARPTMELNLHEELNGSPLSISSDGSILSLTSGESRAAPMEGIMSDVEASPCSQKQPYLPSRLVLPPPFSSASRNSSSSGKLPAVLDHAGLHPTTSPICPASTIAPVSVSGRAWSSPAAMNAHSQEPPQNGLRLNFFERTMRVISPYRVRTPSTTNSLREASPASSHADVSVRTPATTYRVYDDSVSASIQPQTPAQLPEARHQSRYHPSFTAPIGQRNVVANTTITSTRRSRLAWHHLPFSTPSRRQTQRTQSPLGMRSRGFEGLYGGRENGDEEQDWADGIRFDNAGIRLWGLRDARNEGRSTRNTTQPAEMGAR